MHRGKSGGGAWPVTKPRVFASVAAGGAGRPLRGEARAWSACRAGGSGRRPWRRRGLPRPAAPDSGQPGFRRDRARPPLPRLRGRGGAGGAGGPDQGLFHRDRGLRPRCVLRSADRSHCAGRSRAPAPGARPLLPLRRARRPRHHTVPKGGYAPTFEPARERAVPAAPAAPAPDFGPAWRSAMPMALAFALGFGLGSGRARSSTAARRCAPAADVPRLVIEPFEALDRTRRRHRRRRPDLGGHHRGRALQGPRRRLLPGGRRPAAPLRPRRQRRGRRRGAAGAGSAAAPLGRRGDLGRQLHRGPHEGGTAFGVESRIASQVATAIGQPYGAIFQAEAADRLASPTAAGTPMPARWPISASGRRSMRRATPRPGRASRKPSGGIPTTPPPGAFSPSSASTPCASASPRTRASRRRWPRRAARSRSTR